MKPSGSYYDDRLSAEQLRRCYEVATPRVRQYLQAEIEFVQQLIEPGESVLEIGCGYGRALEPIVGPAYRVFGVDTTVGSLVMAAETIGGDPHCDFVAMDAGRLAFADNSFDIVFCIQNGIAVFGVDRQTVVDEAIRVTRPGGRVLFSSYSMDFWDDRLEWFRIQAAHGLLGEIDEEATGGGVIACKDGFRSETARPEEFERLAQAAGCAHEIVEVDGSSVFCVISAP
jgi:ubiquinone/menaquinone biosynthesis C-methylase UbiE